MNYLMNGGMNPEKVDLLISLTGIRSEDVVAAVKDHLIKGYPLELRADGQLMSSANLNRAIKKINAVAAKVERCKEIDLYGKTDTVKTVSNVICSNDDQGSFDLIVESDGTVNDKQDVFDYWLMRMAKSAKTKLTPKRKRLIEARIREGYSVEDIKQAIDGCAASAFHMGQNDGGTLHNDLTLILRSGDKLEHFRDNVGAVTAPLIPMGPALGMRKSKDITAQEIALDTSWAD